jgi:hypothetical protein
MKTNHRLPLAAVVIGLAIFPSAGCAEKEKAANPAPVTAKESAATAPAVEPAPAPKAATVDAASAKWADIKDLTYDAREQFFTGFNQLEARVDAQISELAARRAAMKSTADTKDWDFAMKEMGNARAYLKSAGEELGKATPQTWDQQKDKAGQAWVRTQEAYGKVKSSTTS